MEILLTSSFTKLLVAGHKKQRKHLNKFSHSKIFIYFNYALLLQIQRQTYVFYLVIILSTTYSVYHIKYERA